MKTLQYLIQLSRPRFWTYTLGPYIIGLIIAGQFWNTNHWWVYVLLGVYFMLGVNLWIYGLNDIGDKDVDVHNTKKEGYETKFIPHAFWWIIGSLVVFHVPLFLWSGLYDNMTVFGSLVIFLTFGFCYSLPPLRFKVRPFVDSLSNGYYALPGIIGFIIAGGDSVSWIGFAGAWLWCSAMHAYSAIPDIKPDAKGGIQTTATVLGLKNTGWYCIVLYTLAGVLAYGDIGWLAVVGVIVYNTLVGISMTAKDSDDVMQYYTWFPIINALFGAAIWWYYGMQYLPSIF